MAMLQVCSESLREATHDRAIQVLRQTPAVVTMVVFRDEVQLKDEDMYDSFTVELLKKPGTLCQDRVSSGYYYLHWFI